MLMASFEMQNYLSRLNSVTALPLTIGAGATAGVSFQNIVVPRNELWQVSFLGVRVSLSVAPVPALVTIDAAVFSVTVNAGAQVWTGPGNAATLQIPFPVQVQTQTGSGRYDITCPLQGIALQAGDTLAGSFSLTNGSAGAFDIVSVDGAVRFLPMRLVSELAVAGLQAQRQDQLLDVRLRQSRG